MNACEKSMNIISSIESEFRARDTDWQEVKMLSKKLGDPEVSAKMSELDELRNRMVK